MTDAELPDDVPEADALEQRQEVGPVGDADVSDDPEAPEADALEQRREVSPRGNADLSDGMEVPEADALDQSRVVPTDDEPDPEGA
ncbi:MAG: hypothetical protein ACLGIC_10890 [Acidimicrobiia bacterium]